MSRRLFTALSLAVLAILTGISLTSSNSGFSPPPKLIVLFSLIFIAAAAIRLSVYWLRYPLLITSIAYLGFYEGSCLCPNGSLQNIFLFLGQSKMALIGLYLLEISVLLSLIFLFGNLYCGWVCHKGGIQEFLFKPRWAIRVPLWLDNILRHGRIALLIFIIFYPLLAHQKFFNKIDPFKALFNLRGSLGLLIFLGITLIASVFIYRPFCRYFCPFGVLASWVNAAGLFRIKAGESCVACRLCVKTCPTGALSISRKGASVETDFKPELCFSCLECRKSCLRGRLKIQWGQEVVAPRPTEPVMDRA